MKTFKVFLALIITLSISIQCYTQGGGIDSVTMTPVAPTISDTITIIIYNIFYKSPCDLQERYYDENLPDINNLSKYCYGIFNTICYEQDTIKIPPLSPGSYFLHCKLESAESWHGCDPYYPVDSEDFQFNVIDPVFIENPDEMKNIFQISYNQGLKKLMINLNQEFENYSVVIQNILGRELYRSKINNSRFEIYIKWADGIYLVTVYNDKRKQTQKLIIYNNL